MNVLHRETDGGKEAYVGFYDGSSSNFHIADMPTGGYHLATGDPTVAAKQMVFFSIGPKDLRPRGKDA